MIRSSLNCILLLLTFFSVSSGRPDRNSAELRVRVLANNLPVVGATVFLSGSDIGRNARTEYTNEAGECRFSRLAEGSYTLRVSKLSFFSMSDGTAAESELVFTAGETKIFQTYLTKGGVITGRLLSGDNEALTGIPVTARRVDSTNPQRHQPPAQLESNVTSMSDDRGIFRIYGLQPGTYLVVVNAQRDTSLRKDIRPLRYLGSADSKSSSGIFVGLSEEVKLPDIKLISNLFEACSISGTVRGKGNLPLPEATVSLLRIDDQMLSDKLRTSAAGGFAFENLVPGRYRLTVSSKQGAYRSSTEEVSLGEAGNRSLVISLAEYPAVEGRTYLIRNEKPESLPMVSIALTPLDGGEGIYFASGSKGTFSVRASRHGSFAWDLPSLARNQYLSHIAYAEKDITSSPLLVGDKSISDIVIYISTGAAGIEGRFLETIKNGCEGLRVYALLLSAEDNTVQRWKRANTCVGSSFAIYSLPPGRYYLVALPVTDSENASSFQYQVHALSTALKESRLTRQDTFTLGRNEKASRQPVVLVLNAGALR